LPSVLPNKETALDDFGRAYILGLPYDKIRKQRKIMGKGSFSSLVKNKKCAELVPTPKYEITERSDNCTVEPNDNKPATLSLMEIENTLYRYINSALCDYRFAEAHNIPLNMLTHLLEVATNIEKETGFLRYGLSEKHKLFGNVKANSGNNLKAFSVAENHRVKECLASVIPANIQMSGELQKLKNQIEIWIRSYREKESANIFVNLDELNSLNNLYLSLFNIYGVDLTFASESYREYWTESLPANISLRCGPVPDAFVKTRPEQMKRAQLKIRGASKRQYANRVLFIVSVYLTLHNS
jgi:hypothetical protein